VAIIGSIGLDATEAENLNAFNQPDIGQNVEFRVQLEKTLTARRGALDAVKDAVRAMQDVDRQELAQNLQATDTHLRVHKRG